jgi:type II secretory pathway pseudopilin PulG
MKKGPRITLLEVVIAVAILGSLLAVAIPAFARNVHLTYYAEPVDGLARLSEAAVQRAEVGAADPFPKTAPLTPATPPRGVKAVDPPGTWDHPTWTALGFRAAPEGVPHAFSFGFDGAAAGAAPSFVARARGDLDGDGVLSNFEVSGGMKDGRATVNPGMYVESELE